MIVGSCIYLNLSNIPHWDTLGILHWKNRRCCRQHLLWRYLCSQLYIHTYITLHYITLHYITLHYITYYLLTYLLTYLFLYISLLYFAIKIDDFLTGRSGALHELWPIPQVLRSGPGGSMKRPTRRGRLALGPPKTFPTEIGHEKGMGVSPCWETHSHWECWMYIVFIIVPCHINRDQNVWSIRVVNPAIVGYNTHPYTPIHTITHPILLGELAIFRA